MIDVGSGDPILIIPGIQGRWEWMRPAIDALAATSRVLSFSLSEVPCDPQCFDRWEAYIEGLLDAAGIDRITLVGVSFGGVVAARFASRHASRVNGLVLVSAPGPGFQMGRRLESYLRRPLLSYPAFVLRAAVHLLPEVIASQPTWAGRAAFMVKHVSRTLRYPADPRKIAVWTKTWTNGGAPHTGVQDPQALPPTLVLTGEPVLDRVVPVASTLEYLNLIQGARYVRLRHTGHLGIVSTPQVFARVVGEFIRELDLHGSGRIDRSTPG